MEKSASKGIICFFDILGYQNIINNNSIYECAKIIKNVLVGMPKTVKEDVFKYISNNENVMTKTFETIIKNNLNIIMVSDSMILLFDIDETINFDYIIIIALAYITRLFSKSFELGFPMRGCIDVGQFYYYENVFAGDSIVRTYNECNKLDFSGVVITDKMQECIERVNRNFKKILDERVLKYLSPLKNGIEEYKFILKWFNNDDYTKNYDVRQYVFNSFQKYNKDISISALRKLNNTENTLRFFLAKENKK
jgi:hypothetical protein